MVWTSGWNISLHYLVYLSIIYHVCLSICPLWWLVFSQCHTFTQPVQSSADIDHNGQRHPAGLSAGVGGVSGGQPVHPPTGVGDGMGSPPATILTIRSLLLCTRHNSSTFTKVKNSINICLQIAPAQANVAQCLVSVWWGRHPRVHTIIFCTPNCRDRCHIFPSYLSQEGDTRGYKIPGLDNQMLLPQTGIRPTTAILQGSDNQILEQFCVIKSLLKHSDWVIKSETHCKT